jgi:hypothetical protein
MIAAMKHRILEMTMRVTACASYAVAGMFVVFAVWAAFGFAFPSEPLPLALNARQQRQQRYR